MCVMRELLIPDSRKWFVTPDLGTNVIDSIRGPSCNVNVMYRDYEW
jgi:hypothetical protein